MPSSVDHQTQAQSLKAILAELSEAELIELIPQLAELLRRTGTEYWWMKKNVFDAFEAHGFHVTQDHFYSPQPTVASLARDLWEGPRYLNPAFVFDADGMPALFEELAPFASELADVPVRGTAGFYWDNNFRSEDILFVDTSHVFKLGNDLHHLLFHVLPALPAGVFVHFHDIFLPREYPPEWVVGRNWLWNEQYLLLAFLMYKQSVPCSLYEPPLSVAPIQRSWRAPSEVSISGRFRARRCGYARSTLDRASHHFARKTDVSRRTVLALTTVAREPMTEGGRCSQVSA
jgi:hypothetical protein